MADLRPVETFGCDAVLFDLDGVLVDSTPVVARVWRDWAGRRGLDAEEILRIAHGRKAVETVRLVAPDLDAAAEAGELERLEIEDLDGVRVAEGAPELLSSLPDDGWTVVTSGTRALATRRLEHAGLPVPDRFVAADDVENGKPHPEAYLRGAELVGARPGSCVVIEDAPQGIRAALAAGMTVVAVTATHGAEELAGADAVTRSLADVRPDPGVAGGSRLGLRVTTHRG